MITGLPVEDTPEKLVIKTADGQRVSVDPRSVEDRRTSDVSLMPEGLAQTMTTQELVDLLSYLTTLRQPVSIVGQYQAIGPLYEPNGTRLIDPASVPDLRAPIADGQGHQLSWRRLAANAEGQADLSLVAAGIPSTRPMRMIPVDFAGEVNRRGWSSTRRPRSRRGSTASRWHLPRRAAIRVRRASRLVDLPRGSSRLADPAGARRAGRRRRRGS